ncbi:TlpA disulfide reductase family protein [Chitinophaga sp. OAE865]|uniref:TlpA family protein disulfide reductase n=1 Tax=Chitinophaga sp. OAE865 TaxID=2817898 RepID=UPI001AEB266F
MKHRILIFFLIHFFCAYGYAQKAGKSIELSGDFHTGTLDGHTLKITTFDMYTRRGARHVLAQQEVAVISGKFSTTISIGGDLGYLNIVVPEKYDADNISYSTFLVEAGDSARLCLVDSTIKFKGRDSAKFTCQLELAKIAFQYPYTGVDSDSGFFDSIASYNEDILSRQLIFLGQYHNKFDKQYFNVLACSFRFKSYYTTVSSLNYPTVDEDSIRLKRRLNFLSKYFDEKTSVGQHHKECSYSYQFIDFLFAKEVFNWDNSAGNRAFSDLYRSIKHKYRGVIRDHLLVLSLNAKLSSSPNREGYIEKALEVVNDDVCRRILMEMNTTQKSGVVAYNFQLQDTSGNIVSLSDLRGNVVVLDFYFTGCTGCIALAKAMKPVLDSVKPFSNIKFVSINVDKTPAMFRAAVKSGLYTHSESINLYTNGKGMDNDLIRYYNIQSMPALIIVDKNGRLLSRNPPRPSTSDIQVTNRFIDLLRSSL